MRHNIITKIVKLSLFIFLIVVCIVLYRRISLESIHIISPKAEYTNQTEQRTIGILNVKLSSDDIKALYQSSDWITTQMLKGIKEYNIDIKTGEDIDEGYQLRIDNEVYYLYKKDDGIIEKKIFLDVIKSYGIEGTSPELIKLSFNEVDMGEYILEKKIVEQVRDNDKNYFMSLESDSSLIREIKYYIDSQFINAIDYFDKDKLAKYMAIYKLIAQKNEASLNQLKFKYDNKTNNLIPYVTINCSPTIIKYSDSNKKLEYDELEKLYEYDDDFRDLVNSYIINYINEKSAVKKVIEGFETEKVNYKEQEVVDILNKSFEYTSNDIYTFNKKIEGERRKKLKFELDGKWKYLEASHGGGFYTQPFDLIFETYEGCEIYYTLDGSLPTDKDILYTEPIAIKSRIGEKDVLTGIKNISLGWKMPKTESFKGTVIRSAVYFEGKAVSEIMTNTYFVDENIYSKYSMPIVSLTTDSDNLFDRFKGIYVLGIRRENWLRKNPGVQVNNGTSANYTARGSDWERPVHIEWYETDGSLGFSQNLGARINGGWSRCYPLKPLRLYARSEYDNKNKIEFEIFPGLQQSVSDKTITEFKTFLLRNSGHDFVLTMFEDAMIQSLMENTHVDTQAYRPVIVFINGEYWGIHNARERQDEEYIESHYDMDEDEIVLLENRHKLLHGEEEDINHYLDMLKYIKSHNIEDKETYNYVKTMMDIDNYIDYNIIELYIVNLDWMGNNVKYWRKKTDVYKPLEPYGHDGRWRWLLFDTEAGFAYYDYNMIEYATIEGKQTGLNSDWATFLFRTLLQNKDFKNQFLTRYADLLNTNLNEDKILKRIDEMQEKIKPEMEEHINRWGYPNSLERWEENVDVLREFAVKRPEYVRRNLINHFGLKGTVKGMIQPSDGGYIEINGMKINIDKTEFNGIYFKDIPIEIKAVPNKGYIFNGFQGSYLGEEENITITPDKDFEIKALFVQKTE